MPDLTTYQQQLEAAGFKIEHLEDMSQDWSSFTSTRLQAYRADRARHVRVHGEATVDALDVFYTAVNKYFQSGKLGGIRLCARKI